MKRKLILSSTILFLFALIGSFFFFETKNYWLQFYFDATQDNPAVTSKADIDKVLHQFETISYKKLDKAYLDHTLSNDKRFKNMLRKSTYYKVPQSALNQKLVGHFRIKHFMGKDQYLRDCVLGRVDTIIWLMDKRVIYKTLELQDELEKAGYDRNAFVVYNGHRAPQYNELIKGARKSRHIKGEAVDISIKDIDRNGRINSEDKKIVLNLLDKKIIRNSGGLGLYPGTQSVHYDVRGRRARWNSYKR